MALTVNEKALANEIAAEVISAIPSPVESARRANFMMARQLTIAYLSFGATIVVTLFIDQNLPRWPLWVFAFFLFITSLFWNSRANQFRREGGDPYLVKMHERRLFTRVVVMVPLVIILVLIFGLAGYSGAMLKGPLAIVFVLWFMDLIGVMRSQSAERSARTAEAASETMTRKSFRV